MITALLNKWRRNQLKDPNYLWLLEPYEGDEVVVLDTETTGLNPKKDEILSIGAVIIRDGKVVMYDAFECFVKPTNAITEESIKIHHIRACDMAAAIEPNEAILALIEYIRNRPIVGYYISFDRAILSRYTKKLLGIPLPNVTIELSSMYYKRYRKESAHEFVDLKFDTIMEKLTLPFLGKHDALNDAIMSAMMYLKLKTMPEYRGAYS